MGQREELRLMNTSGHAPMLGVDLAGTTTGWVLAWNNSSARVEVAAPGSGGGAPTDADYLVKTSNGSLSAERVVTDGTYIGWDWSVAGQAKATLLSSALTSIASGTWTGATSITTLGTVATGTWQGATLGVGYGGTGLSSYTAGDLLYASGATTLAKLAAGTAGDQLRQGASSTPGWAGPTGWWGSGADGTVAFDGTNTFGFATTTGAAPNLVYTLTRDVEATNISVSSGITVNTGGFQLYATGTLSGAGTIRMVGADANVGTAGTGFSDVGSLNVRSQSGGAGRVNTSATGNNGTGGAQTIGAAGGAGGAGGANGGGSGGAVTAPTAAMGAWRTLQVMVMRLRAWSTTSAIQLRAGCGGGGGGSNGVAGTSGGGGSGGGLVLIWARYVTFTGTISAKGGNGGNATNSGAGSYGGGGGGGGGYVAVVTTSPTATYTATAAGGTKGTGANGGANGSDGSAGVTDHFVI
jgi:hypothetical protein